MKKILFYALAALSNLPLIAQTIPAEIPSIEIQARAEKEITPNEIYIMITLLEVQDGRKTLKITEQEIKLKKIVKDLGIPTENLTLFNAQANLQNINSWGKKDVVDKKVYSLKVNTAETLGKLYQELNKISINEAAIYKTRYSNQDSIYQELRIEAMKKAKKQALVMTQAIGESLGKPLMIREDNIPMPYPMARGFVSTLADDVAEFKSEEINNYSIEFKPIKFEVSVYVKFSIK